MANIIDRTGEINYNTFGSKMIIKEYRKAIDIDVYFPEYDYVKEHVGYNHFIKGYIACPYEKTIFNIGYTGEGKYKVTINGKNTKHYNLWNAMLKRCYSSKFTQQHPTYKECEVCPEWHNFQAFAEWVDRNYYEIEGERMALDKDILCKGNKIYSPNTCMFVPQRINTLFIKCDNSRGDLPVGVFRVNKKYNARCNINGKRKHLGYYNTPEEAFEVYKNFKEKEIKKVAEEYKNVIPQKLYNAMVTYQVDIDD